MRRLRAAAVVDDGVDGSALDAGDLVLGGEVLDRGGQGSGRDLAVEAQKVGTETSDVGRSHGSSGDGVL